MSSGFCRVDDRRRRQRAAALPHFSRPDRAASSFLRIGGYPRRGRQRALGAAASPPIVSDWIARLPEWAAVAPVPQEQIESITDHLDLGERAAIALAGAIGADLLLMDDATGRPEG